MKDAGMVQSVVVGVASLGNFLVAKAVGSRPEFESRCHSNESVVFKVTSLGSGQKSGLLLFSTPS